MEVSVIIPTYKPKEYIWQCLDSLEKKTINSSKFEVLIVLNGCKEPYFDKIKEYIAPFSSACHFKLLQTDIPGVSHARNVGVENAEGRFLCFLDDDDFVSPEYLEGLYSCMNKPDVDVVVSNVKAFDENTGNLSDDYLTRSFRRNKQNKDLNLCAMRSLFSTVWCKAIRREVVADRKFDESFRIGEDALFMASVTNRVKSVRFAPEEAVYYRRLRMESASRGKMSLGFIAGNALKLWQQYAKIYFSDVSHYDGGFFLTRLLAVVKNHALLFKKNMF